LSLSYNNCKSTASIGDPAVKWVKWTVRTILGLAFVLAVFIAFLPRILDAVIYNKLLGIRQEGYPISTADLDVPKPRHSENAALIYVKAFDVIEDSDSDEDFDTLTRFLSWQERASNANLWREVQRIVQNHQAVIPIVKRASELPECRFEANWKDGPLDVQFPYLGKVRRLTTLLASSAVLNAHNGNMGRAVEHLGLTYKVAESLRSEPTLVGQQVRAHCLQIASVALQTVVAHGDISEEQAKKLHGILSQIDPYAGFVKAMWGERAMGIDLLEGVRKGDRRVIAELLNTQSGAFTSNSLPKLGWLYRLRAADDELFYLQSMQTQIAAARFPYRLLKPEVRNSPPNFPVYALGSAILCPDFGESARVRDEAVARIYGDRILVALMSYKYLFSSYPHSLKDLGKVVDWPLPKDPFSGRDFVYRRDGEGFILYSIGSDLKDNGGRVYPATVTTQSSLPYSTFDGRVSADIVWMCKR
jgi:hypothetical protein